MDEMEKIHQAVQESMIFENRWNKTRFHFKNMYIMGIFIFYAMALFFILLFLHDSDILYKNRFCCVKIWCDF